MEISLHKSSVLQRWFYIVCFCKRYNKMDNDEKLELIKLSATDFDGFKQKFETLTLVEQTEFKQYMEMVQDYLKNNENRKIQDKTGFPPPS